MKTTNTQKTKEQEATDQDTLEMLKQTIADLEGTETKTNGDQANGQI